MERRLQSLAGLIAVVLLVGSGCGGGSSPAKRGTGEGRSASMAAQDRLSRFYDQELEWGACPAGEVPKGARVEFQCAEMEVPLDYRNPDGGTINLALNRIPAQNPKERLGSLATNPGGPGGSGLTFVYEEAPTLLTPDVLAHYDIVGMDPRGVGRSSPVQCMTAKESAKMEAKDLAPLAQAEAFVKGCDRRSGRLLPFVRTDSTARDLDVLRAVLGEEKLNYLGLSYGTVLGQFYANRFPKQTGRMVLDSVANPAAWPGDPSAQALAFETALRVFVKTCTGAKDCPMGRNRAKAIKRIDDLAGRLEKQPLKTGKRTPPITSDVLLEALGQSMYKEETWPALAAALAAAFKGNGKPFAKFTNTGSGDSDSGPEPDVPGGFDAIACPHIPPEQRTLNAVKQDAEEAKDVAPVFGDIIIGIHLKCALWPAKSLRLAGRAVTAQGAPPILLVHNRYDAATPVQWARGVHAQLAKSVLVTNAAGGHVFYPKGPCTKKVIDNYLIDGKLPAKGTTCKDHGPNDPSTAEK